jgi:hypothetical protein
MRVWEIYFPIFYVPFGLRVCTVHSTMKYLSFARFTKKSTCKSFPCLEKIHTDSLFVFCTVYICLLVEWDWIKLQEIGNATKVGTQM